MFSKKPEQAQATAARTKMANKAATDSSTFSVMGPDVTIKGNISATTELHIDGVVEGDIACASIVQGDNSTIEGAIEAENARIAGTVKGSISARNLVILRTARIQGDVYYDALTIEQGAEVEGRFAPKKPAASAPVKVETLSGQKSEPTLSVAR